MKKYGLEILFVLITIAWFFLYRGHLFYWESSDLFLISGEYWNRYALKPGGWGEYAGNFLALFFRWKLAGAMMLAFTDVCWAWGIAGILKRLGVGHFAGGGAVIGIGVLIALQCNLYFTMSYTLQLLTVLFSFYGYLEIGNKVNRFLLFSLGCPFAFFLLLPAQGGLLYAAFILSEWIYRGKGHRISLGGMLGWMVFWGVLPYYWRNIVLIPEWMTYAFTDMFHFTRPQRYLIGIAFAWPVWLLVFGFVYNKSKVSAWIVTGMAGVLVAWFTVNSFQGSLEKRLRMLEAIQMEKWDELKAIAATSRETDEEFLYLETLADAKEGKLPDRLFGYPCRNVGALWIPRNLDYFSNLCGATLFRQLGIRNEAMVRMFQAAETTPWSVDLITLRTMILLNMEMGNHVLAEKYLGILKQVPFYGKWVRARQRELQSGARIDPDYWLQDKPDFFVSGKGFSLNMENIVKAYPENRMAWDYLLCGLLIQKNIPKFYDCFIKSPYHQAQVLPSAYEEALLIYAAQKREPCTYPISAERKQLLQEYQEYYRRYQDKKDPEAYFPERLRYTVWFYFHFVDNRTTTKENAKIRESVYEK